MLRSFNLIASTYRGRENDLLSELWYFLRELGDPNAQASLTGLPGLVVLNTRLDPFQVVESIRERAKEEPWYFSYLLKVVPIEKCVPASLGEISSAARSIAEKRLEPGDTFKVEVRKRLTQLKSKEVIEAVASQIDNRVSLENPDKIILVEIIGDVAGISVVEPRHIVSIQRLRRESRQTRESPGPGGQQ